MRTFILACVIGLAACKPPATAEKKITVAMMPKDKGNSYFISCKTGADEAAKELGVELLWDGPTGGETADQVKFIETWTTRGVDVIAVSVNNKEAVAPALRKARQKGIKVITWDADTVEDARDFLVNQATPQGIGTALMDNAARILGGKGEFAIITAHLTAANQNEWIKHIRARQAEKYPDVKFVADPFPSDDKQDEAFKRAQEILRVYPNVKCIMAICSPGVPGAAEAVKQAGRQDVKVMGLALPNDCKKYIHEGWVDCIILWNTMDLGYLTIQAAQAMAKGQLKAGDKEMQAGKLKKIEIQGSQIMLGAPFVFDKSNVDKFDF
jgi:rhamnose transport system permease protein